MFAQGVVAPLKVQAYPAGTIQSANEREDLVTVSSSCLSLPCASCQLISVPLDSP